MQVTTEEQAFCALIDWQVQDGCLPTIPASAETVATDLGWAFFNVNGYLGTVTENGDFVTEPALVDAE